MIIFNKITEKRVVMKQDQIEKPTKRSNQIIFNKLQVKSRTEVVFCACALGLFQ